MAEDDRIKFAISTGGEEELPSLDGSNQWITSSSLLEFILINFFMAIFHPFRSAHRLSLSQSPRKFAVPERELEMKINLNLTITRERIYNPFFAFSFSSLSPFRVAHST